MKGQFVGFKLGKEEFGIDVMDVQEIIDYQEITHIPEMPEFIEGVIDLRGKILPVLDLRKRFNIEAPISELTKILILKYNGEQIGAIVDEVTEVVTPDVIERPPESIAKLGKEYIVGIARKGKRILIIIDAKKILSDIEKKELKEVNL